MGTFSRTTYASVSKMLWCGHSIAVIHHARDGRLKRTRVADAR
jgi:hypothetical protein